MNESLLVGSKTRAALKAHGVNVGAGALDALNAVVHWYIDQAAQRAAANRRKTVRAHDFIIIDDEAAAAPPPLAAPQEVEVEVETAPVSSDYAESAVPAADEAVEEAAEEEPPPAWSSD